MVAALAPSPALGVPIAISEVGSTIGTTATTVDGSVTFSITPSLASFLPPTTTDGFSVSFDSLLTGPFTLPSTDLTIGSIIPAIVNSNGTMTAHDTYDLTIGISMPISVLPVSITPITGGFSLDSVGIPALGGNIVQLTAENGDDNLPYLTPTTDIVTASVGTGLPEPRPVMGVIMLLPFVLLARRRLRIQ
jgi:hypothetical protein